VRIEESTRDGCVVVSLHGALGMEAAPAVRQALLKGLGEQPKAVICDLSDVESIDPACASLFLAVVNQGDARWPATGFLLCGAVPAVATVLIRLRVHQFVPLHATLADAFRLVENRPPYLHDQMILAPTSDAAAAARLFAREVYDYWRLAVREPGAPAGAENMSLIERLVLVASELVTNAVLHAGTDLRLRIELRENRLWVKVSDRAPQLLASGQNLERAEGGRGLVLVNALASSWGVHPDRLGGKVVWAAFNLAG
jgi:anti-anti-sigma factor